MATTTRAKATSPVLPPGGKENTYGVWQGRPGNAGHLRITSWSLRSPEAAEIGLGTGTHGSPILGSEVNEVGKRATVWCFAGPEDRPLMKVIL